MLVYNVMRKLVYLLVLLAFAIFSSVALAYDYTVYGSFRPDPLNPANNKFTLWGDPPGSAGYCDYAASWQECIDTGISQFVIPQIRPGGERHIPANPVGRDVLTIAGRGNWHTVDIVSEEGFVNAVQVRIVAATWSVFPSPSRNGWRQFIPGFEGDERTAYSLIFGASGYFGACRNIITASSDTMYVVEFSPSAPTLCQNVNALDISVVRRIDTSAAIQVLAPNPLSMKAGNYTGYLNLVLGNGGDIDLGADTVDGPFVVRLSLSVEHAFGVQFPGGSALLSLVPEGGWMAWLQRGRKPTRLFRDQKFDIQSSVPFKVRLICEFPAGAACGIQNGGGHRVPLEVSVSLPAGFLDSANQPVARYPLTGVASPSFMPDGYQVKKATMHFEVPKADMETMLDHTGTRYSGNVTILFEPDL